MGFSKLGYFTLYGFTQPSKTRIIISYWLLKVFKILSKFQRGVYNFLT